MAQAHNTHTNICTINARGLKPKKALLLNLLTLDNIHVAAITETLLSPKIVFNIPRFQQFRWDYPARRQAHGGVLLIINNAFPSTLLAIPPPLAHLQLSAATIHAQRKTLNVYAHYNPPLDRLSWDLLELISNSPATVLLGDFNARHTDFRDTADNRNGRILVKALTELNLHRITSPDPTFFGYNGTSIVDHIIITTDLIPYFVPQTSTGACITSDHSPIIAHCSLFNPPQTLQPNFTFNDWDNANWPGLTHELTNLVDPNAPLPSEADIFSVINALTDAIQTATRRHVPLKEIRPHRATLPPHIIRLIREKTRTRNQWRRTPLPTLKTLLNKQDAQIRKLTREHRDTQWDKVCDKLEANPSGRRFWNTVKKVTGQKRARTYPLTVNNIPIGDSLTKATLFANFLEETFTIDNDPHFSANHLRHVTTNTPNYPTLPLPQPPHDNPLTEPLSEEMVTAALLRTKHSAPGRDGITYQVLKHLPPNCITLLTRIYNTCLLTGYYPPQWKTADITMLLKPHKPSTLPSSYRPISLLNTQGKIFERLLTERLTTYTTEREIIPNTQYGFRPHSSTADPILKIFTQASTQVNHGHCALAIFLDLERAFDKVWHQGLLYKLHLLNFPPPFSRLVQSFLTNRDSRVKIGLQVSPSFTPLAGVPQGSILSPSLWNLYCHDIPQPDSPFTSLAQYADDTTYWSIGRTSFAANHRLQHSIRRLEHWLSLWRIRPNPNKTQLVLFRHHHLTRRLSLSANNIHITLWNTAIPLSPHATYLGIDLDQSLSLRQDTARTLKAIRSRTSIFGSIIYPRGRRCSIRITERIYTALIRPLVEYRRLILPNISAATHSKYDSLERSIIRRIHRLSRLHPNREVYRESRITPLHERLHKLQGRYVQRAIELNRADTLTTLATRPALPTRAPKNKYPHPTAMLLQATTHPLPPQLSDILDNTPLPQRRRRSNLYTFK